MRRISVLVAVTFIAVLAVADAALAGSANEFEADLDGAQEVPAVATAATGEAEFKVVGDTLEYKLEAENIDDVIAGHIHPGAPGVEGPPIVDLNIPAACEADDEEGELKCEATLALVDTEGLLEQMRAGNTYVNVHTTEFPGGEIRGQLVLDE